MAESVIIDCDPGQDDAINLLLAMASPDELDILAITAVAGNVPLELTERNARLICDLAGRDDLPVFAGLDRPLVRDLVTAENVHGGTGIDGMPVSPPRTPLQDRHAVDYLVDRLRDSAPDSVTLIPTGPLTNIAAAIERDSGVLKAVRRIVLMGGAMRESGNHSPSAEFNMLVDPQAADIVLRCGRPITMLGLDVTHQVLATPERIEAIAALANPVAEATAGMLGFFNRHDTKKYRTLGAPLHDPCTVAYLLAPALFESRRCNVTIETQSELTMGHTAVDFWHVTSRPENVDWVHAVDADGFFALLTSRLARYGN
ncbi:MAG: nucleoside hydrolase [Woeseiaceae bacterium]|nr:nucleoside hydrolase [Woeseiaceae bacterium]